MYHKFILEHNDFYNKYFVLDESPILEKLIGEGAKSPRYNAYKEWHDAQMNQAQGKEILDLQTLDRLEKMKDKLFRHRYCYSLLNNGEAEKSFYCQCQYF